MSLTPEQTAQADGTVLRRPPVRKATIVRSDVAHTFDAFVRTLGAWWPTETFSAGRERVRDLTLERRVGGRVCETWDDGTVVEWGEIKAWDPPNRFTMSWSGTPEETEVELTFRELGPSLTRVAVEHRGWEALTDSQLAEDCALPGGYKSGAYAVGWQRILDAFATTFDGNEAGTTMITDDYMREMIAKTKVYTLVLIKDGPNRNRPDADAVIWEHGRRNFGLRATGVLAIVCPVSDDTVLDGLYVFDAPVEEVRRIMDEDPGVKVGLFIYEVHEMRGFPGDKLPT